MPLRTVASLDVQRLEILAADGKLDEALLPKMSKELLLNIHRLMFQIRAFDERAVLLQRQGRLGTYPMITGQEATQCVPPLCLKPTDWVVPTYRGGGVYFARGMSMRHALLYWAGDDRGTRFPEANNDLTFSIPVGAHLTQAAGLAWAEKLKKTGGVALTYCGDGTSSKGDLHEALTFAGQFKLPAIFLIENNGWAISVPRSRQAASQTLAQKAWGYGVFGLQVDGNDALAVYRATSEAVARARKGEGPSLLECETYRMGHHTTADDASRYRDPAEVAAWRAKDPIERLERFLRARGLWDDEKGRRLAERTRAWIDEEIAAYEAFPPPNPLDMFSFNYDRAPWMLREQRAELERLLALKGGAKALEALSPAEGRFP
ncbi:MAG: pyruvate dehydrogenase (acetyl-transferring) E1 component subunit alpha [Elusimicrobia bacterium]|nr:pyruvate dehydrogenase (acetyl-transferring) E1 component subunit alpha [Elusimicrobiota bacterium]MDE2237084.1 pyruvate dehydrogenase (acetyl-transferring) E1 component subunit alpha [Elusimicrobiota bacterium]MDE2426879.1 pyruvate dehydrogenase (acetyl-transferring) E1 component subunit alpha [Elusimicrobiota bacterium]